MVLQVDAGGGGDVERTSGRSVGNFSSQSFMEFILVLRTFNIGASIKKKLQWKPGNVIMACLKTRLKNTMTECKWWNF